METKPAQQNIQDSFLNTARKERHNITIYLVSGVKLTGRIRSFDKYSVVLETSNQEQLIFQARDLDGRHRPRRRTHTARQSRRRWRPSGEHTNPGLRHARMK